MTRYPHSAATLLPEATKVKRLLHQRTIESRQDVLVYTGEPLTDPGVTGGIEVCFLSPRMRATRIHRQALDVEPEARLEPDETISGHATGGLDRESS